MKRLFFYIALFTAAMLTACSDDDSFTTNPSARLTFSRDTVSLDTVFSTVPTSTHTFWIYNNNGDGLRLSQVRLQRGNQSGFRVNVDGSFLDNTTGSSVSDLEIRKGDSIRVFVELTSGLTNSDLPQLVEDNIVFCLESGVEQKVNLRAYSWDAEIYDSLRISEDATISSHRPIIIRKGLRVDNNVTLTLNAPTRLFFHSGAGVDVYGRLIVNSSPETAGDVVFRGDRMDNMFDYLPYDRVSGQWRGIHLFPSSTGNIFYRADIHSAEYGIICDAADEYIPDDMRLTMENVTIHNCKGPGLKAVNSNVSLINCQFSNTLGDCVGIYGGSALMVYCTLAQFYPFSGDRGVALRFTNYYEDQDYPLHLLNCRNTLVTGYADDEVMGETRNEDVKFGYIFSDCILRTPEDNSDTSSEAFVNILWEKPDMEVQGEAHFRSVDADRQYYDFHLVPNSPAVGRASVIPEVPYDRDMNVRGDKTDVGCYQCVSEE